MTINVTEGDDDGGGGGGGGWWPIGYD